MAGATTCTFRGKDYSVLPIELDLRLRQRTARRLHHCAVDLRFADERPVLMPLVFASVSCRCPCTAEIAEHRGSVARAASAATSRRVLGAGMAEPTPQQQASSAQDTRIHGV